MQHNYSDLLIAYIYNEIDAEVKTDLELQLEKNIDLQNELNSLIKSLNILNKVKPCGPSQTSIDTILEKSGLLEEELLID